MKKPKRKSKPTTEQRMIEALEYIGADSPPNSLLPAKRAYEVARMALKKSPAKPIRTKSLSGHVRTLAHHCERLLREKEALMRPRQEAIEERLSLLEGDIDAIQKAVGRLVSR